MKNFFSSPPEDLQSFSRLDVIQKQLRDLRDDNQIMLKQIRILVKGLAILVSSPESEDLEPPEDLEK